MGLSIKDRILQASCDDSKYCLLRVDFNRVCYTKRGWPCEHEIVDFSTKRRGKCDGLSVKVNKEDLLDVCNLFINKFLNGEEVQFRCIRNDFYDYGKLVSFRECEERNYSLIDFSKRVSHIMDCSQTQHFQFSLISKRSELCGFVHGYEALSELTKNMVSNLTDSRIKVKIKL